jgi:hypothetical protein
VLIDNEPLGRALYLAAEDEELVRDFVVCTATSTGGTVRRMLHEGVTQLCDAVMGPDRPTNVGRVPGRPRPAPCLVRP